MPAGAPRRSRAIARGSCSVAAGGLACSARAGTSTPRCASAERATCAGRPLRKARVISREQGAQILPAYTTTSLCGRAWGPVGRGRCTLPLSPSCARAPPCAGSAGGSPARRRASPRLLRGPGCLSIRSGRGLGRSRRAGRDARSSGISMNLVPVGRRRQNIALPPSFGIFGSTDPSISLRGHYQAP